MSNIALDVSVTPGQNALTVSDMGARLDRALAVVADRLETVGGIPPQFELLFCTHPETTTVDLSYRIHDPSGLAGDVPAELAPCPHSTYTSPARASNAASSWPVPLAGEDNQDTPASIRDEIEDIAQDAVLLRLEHPDAHPPESASHYRYDAKMHDVEVGVPPIPMLRHLQQLDATVLWRVHLEPVVALNNEPMMSAEYCLTQNTSVSADASCVEPVGYRPSIDIVLIPDDVGSIAPGPLVDGIYALIGETALVATRYQATSPAETTDDRRAGHGDNSLPTAYVPAQHNIITDTLRRIQAGRGRVMPHGSVESEEIMTGCQGLASVFRIPSAPRLVRNGVDMPGVDSALTGYPASVRQQLLAETGLTLGADPGVLADQLRLAESAMPPTGVVISDDAAQYRQWLAQRTSERASSAGTTVVIDQSGDLAATLRRISASQDMFQTIVSWDVTAHPPAIAPFSITDLLAAGFDVSKAVEFVATTHDYLLSILETTTNGERRGDPSHPGDSDSAVQSVFRAAFRDAAPEGDYETLIEILDDARTRRRLEQYVASRLDTDAGPDVVDLAYQDSVAVHDTLGDVLATTAEQDLLAEMPATVLCVDVSTAPTDALRRMLTVLLIRELEKSLACSNPRDVGPVTVTLDDVTSFSNTDFVAPLIDRASDPAYDVSVVFGNRVSDAESIQSSLTPEASLVTIATTDSFSDRGLAARLLMGLPDEYPGAPDAVTQQASRLKRAAICIASTCLDAQTQRHGASCTVAHPKWPDTASGDPTSTTLTDLPAESRPRIATVASESASTASTASTATNTTPGDSTSDEKNTASEAATKTSLDAGEERGDTTDVLLESNDTGTDVSSATQVALTATSAPDSAAAEAASEVSPTAGVVRTITGPTCSVCGTTYDIEAVAATCHTHETLAAARQSGTSITQQSPPDLTYTDHVLDALALADYAQNLPAVMTTIADQPSLGDALNTIYDAVSDEHTLLDPFSRTLLVAVELARLGVLPGYTLHDSMVPMRDACLKHSSDDIGDLTAAHPDTGSETAYLSSFKFNGARYYELTDTARQAEIVPCALSSAGPVFGTSLRYNLGVVFGAHDIATTSDVAWIQAPHTLAATGTDAFAGFTSDDTLHVIGTVIDADPVAASEDALSRYITTQYERVAATDAEALWIAANSTVAKGLLDVLAEQDYISLPRSLSDSAYSIGQLQDLFVDPLDADGIDHIRTVSQLHQQHR